MTEQSENRQKVNSIEATPGGATAREVVLQLFPDIEQWKSGHKTDEYRTGKVRESLECQPEFWISLNQAVEDMFGKPLPPLGEGHEQLTRAVIIVDELGPGPYALRRAAVMILDGHELIEGWDEIMKSILLDTALSSAINSEHESRDRSRRAKAYFGTPVYKRFEREESATITKYKAAQQKLRASFA